MYHFYIATPERVLFDDFIHSATFPGSDGSFGVLQNHAAIISTLKEGQVVIIDKEKKKQIWSVSGGVVEVVNNRVVLLTDSVQNN